MSLRKFKIGFTLIETIIVAVILAITAMIAVPLISSASSMQLRAAANIVAADLEYAKSLAISQQKYYFVEFDSANEVYRIYDQDMSVVAREDRPDQNCVVDFSSSNNLESVDIQSADFDAASTVSFDYLGSPYSGRGLEYPLNSGAVTLKAGDCTAEIEVEAMTGYIIVKYQ